MTTTTTTTTLDTAAHAKGIGAKGASFPNIYSVVLSSASFFLPPSYLVLALGRCVRARHDALIVSLFDNHAGSAVDDFQHIAAKRALQSKDDAGRNSSGGDGFDVGVDIGVLGRELAGLIVASLLYNFLRPRAFDTLMILIATSSVWSNNQSPLSNSPLVPAAAAAAAAPPPQAAL